MPVSTTQMEPVEILESVERAEGREGRRYWQTPHQETSPGWRLSAQAVAGVVL